ncbi:hypothetical protein EDD16DRAFT_1246806 [Pisolithus croceorrhizus]|nr:hypothetical protein EDD16DRAFT_1246806 [Pisolithus croceorrhizus]KAI6119688.1 hypothetical protein EV401DRAFT_1861144 [Pisolithus croceorrhizus]
MSIPAYPIHTIHGSFAGLPSFSSYCRPLSAYAGVVMDNRIFSDRRSLGFAKDGWSSPHVLPLSPRRPFVPVAMPTVEARRAPPTPRTHVPQLTTFPMQEPFDDANVVPVPIVNNDASLSINAPQLIPHARTCMASQSSHFMVKLPRTGSLDAFVRQRTAQRAAVQDHEARLKAVAGILLNRGNSAGRCGRRLPPNRGPRTYRRSRLSTMISVEDL